MKKDKREIKRKLHLDETLKIGKVLSMNKLLKLTPSIAIWLCTTSDGMHMPLDKVEMKKIVKRNWEIHKAKYHWVKVTANFGLNSQHNCIHVAFIKKETKPKKKVKTIKKKKHAKSKNIYGKSNR